MTKTIKTTTKPPTAEEQAKFRASLKKPVAPTPGDSVTLPAPEETKPSPAEGVDKE
jgi:hypothetical protein